MKSNRDSLHNRMANPVFTSYHSAGTAQRNPRVSRMMGGLALKSRKTPRIYTPVHYSSTGTTEHFVAAYQQFAPRSGPQTARFTVPARNWPENPGTFDEPRGSNKIEWLQL